MKSIILHSATIDRLGTRRDAGEVLRVSATGDVTADAAKRLIDSGRAVEHSNPPSTRKVEVPAEVDADAD